jgi:FkbM family methyltransferase
MDLSYAQNLEDYHLWLAFAGKPGGTYIDIGGGHPVADNVSFWFYERGWRGLVAEPQPELAALYDRLRPRDIMFCGLVGRTSGEADFHLVKRLHGLSSMVETHAANARQHGVDYETVRMPITTLAALCEHHAVAEIDFLKIDVEGAESDVLAGNDWTRFRPKVVVAEAIAPGTGEPAWSAWEPILLNNGYDFALFDTLNRFYVARERPEIRARLPAERAPWHDVRHMYEIGRAPDNALHPDHGLARDLAKGFWASLPDLDPALIAALLARGRSVTKPQAVGDIAATVVTEHFRLSLGRIACGYDGGQIIADADAPQAS